jgi:hypothetical protein
MPVELRGNGKAMRFVEEGSKTSPHVKAFLTAAESGAALPALYATLKRDFSGRDKTGNVKLLLTGQRVRVTEVWKAGDLGVTTDLDEAKRDEARSTWAEMSDYSDVP